MPDRRAAAAIWGPDSKVTNWNQVDPSFPDQELLLFGPGTDSGTFDYFTAEINGEEGASRTDYSPSEDDNITVQGVEGSKGGLGYFGFSYYEDNADKPSTSSRSTAAPGCVAPSAETAQDGTYTPLSRPLFIYPSGTALKQPQVLGFVDYYVENNAQIAEEALFIPLNAEQEAALQTQFAALPGCERLTLSTSTATETAAGTSLRQSRRRPFEAVIKVFLIAAALVAVVTTALIFLSFIQPTWEFFQLVSLQEFLFGTKWAPTFKPASLRGAAPGHGDAADLVHRDARGDAPRAGLGALPERVRLRPGPQDPQAGARGARRHPHRGLRLLRAASSSRRCCAGGSARSSTATCRRSSTRCPPAWSWAS